MSRRSLIGWAAVACVGVLLAAGISLGVRELTSAPVGLESEPISAGEELAPPRDEAARSTDRPGRPQRSRRESTTPQVPTAPAVRAPSADTGSGSAIADDDGGQGRGRGRGRSGGDSGSDDSGSSSGSDDSGHGSDDD